MRLPLLLLPAPHGPAAAGATRAVPDRASGMMDTPDWVTVDPAGKRSTWEEHMKFTPQILKSLPAAFRIEIESLEIRGGGAVVLAVVWARRTPEAGWAGGMRVRDTRVKTAADWMRKLNEKTGSR